MAGAGGADAAACGVHRDALGRRRGDAAQARSAAQHRHRPGPAGAQPPRAVQGVLPAHRLVQGRRRAQEHDGPRGDAGHAQGRAHRTTPAEVAPEPARPDRLRSRRRALRSSASWATGESVRTFSTARTKRAFSRSLSFLEVFSSRRSSRHSRDKDASRCCCSRRNLVPS